MARMSLRSLKAWFPVNLILPTLTLGPSSILKTRITALLEAMRSYCGVTFANWRPRSPHNFFRTTFPFFYFVGSDPPSPPDAPLRSLQRAHHNYTLDPHRDHPPA